MYLSLENERRMVRKKAMAGDEVVLRYRENPQWFPGRLDSLALDGFLRTSAGRFQTGEVFKVKAIGPFQVRDNGKRFLGGLLAASALVYMGGTLVNGWILKNPANQFRYYQTPMIILGAGTALFIPWRLSYRIGGKWQLRVLQY